MRTRCWKSGGVQSYAVYSHPNDAYRYVLARTSDAAKEKVLFVMLNPSTATERDNDRTVARVEYRARKLMDCGAYRVCNLFAYRSTDPEGMFAADDPVGPENDRLTIDSANWADKVVCAWGNNGTKRGRGLRVKELLQDVSGVGTLFHLGDLSKEGQPKHPLYLSYGESLVGWD